MPIPFFPFIAIAISALAAIRGAKEGCQAVADNDRANQNLERARLLQASLKARLAGAERRKTCALERLGTAKLQMWDGTFSEFVNLVQKIKDLHLASTAELDGRSNLKIDRVSIQELKEVCLSAGTFLQGAAGGAVAGGLAAFGAYGTAGTFAVASTGTAISGLSGVAATNATLAALGGGSLAAGGLGMAGGTLVLGGLVAGPALAVLGCVLRAQASAKLDKTRTALAEVRSAEAEVGVVVVGLDGIVRHADMMRQALASIDEIFRPALERLAHVVKAKGCDYARYGAKEQAVVAAVLGAAQAAKSLLDAPLLNRKGALSASSKAALGAAHRYLAEVAS